ncbi:MAG: beta strand repeat-containing protein [Elainella sp.]
MGYGAATTATTDDVGLSLVDVTFSLDVAADRTYTYTITEGKLNAQVMDGLQLSVDNVTASGNKDNASLTLSDYKLGLGGVSYFSGDSLTYDLVQTANGRTVAFGTTNLNGLIGYGADTLDTSDDVGLKINNANLEIGLSADQTYRYSLTDANLALVGISGLPISANSVTVAGDQTKTEVSMGAFNLGFGGMARASGAQLNFLAQQTEDGKVIKFSAAGVNAFVGHGADTMDTSDDVGLEISSADLELLLNANNTYSYSFRNGNVATRGLESVLTLVAQQVNLTGDQTGAVLTTGKFNLGLGSVARVDGDAIAFSVQQTAEGRAVTFSGANLNSLLGYGADTSDTSDDVGLSITNAGLTLSLKADKSYDYLLKNANVAVLGVSGLTLNASNINASGNQTSTVVTLGSFELGVGSVARLSGNALNFSAVQTAEGTAITLGGSNIAALVGYGAETAITNDDIGLSIQNASLEVALNADKTYRYGLYDAQAAVVGINGLTLSADSITAIGDQSNTTVSLQNYALGVGGLVSLTGETLDFSAQQMQDGKQIGFSATNVSAFVGKGADTAISGDDVGLGISGAGLTLAIAANRTYSYTLTADAVQMRGLEEVTLNAENITATGNGSSTLVTLGNFALGLGDTIALGGSGLRYEANASGLKLGATDSYAFVGTGYGTSEAIGIGLSDLDLGMVLYQGANGSTYALQASGAAALLGGSADLQLTADQLSLSVNRTGGAVNESITLPNGQSVVVNFTAAEGNLTHLQGSADLNVAGFATASGEFFFEQNVVSGANGDQTTLLIGATDVNAFVGSGATGLQVSDGRLGLVVERSGGVSKYAMNASGAASLLGVNGVTLSGEVALQVNRMGAVDQMIATPNGSVAVVFAPEQNNLTQAVGNLSLGIDGFAALSGNFNIQKTPDALRIGATDVAAFVGAAGSGLQVSDANLGLIVETDRQNAYALIANGNASLVGVSALQ